ncbi:MAG: alpha/beta hydrolase, partial [Actinobacteria bacterium]
AMLTATRHPEVVERLVLVDPALPPPSLVKLHPEVWLKLAGPTIPLAGPRLMRLYHRTHTPEEHNKESLAFICADPDTVEPAMAHASLEMTRLRRTIPWAVDGFVEAARSIAAYSLNRKRFDDLVHRVTQPTLLIHGAEDQLVPVGAAQRIAAMRPDWDVRVWEGIGHVPMIEDQARFTAELVDYLG